jgi:diguanylate cyclase (GGDEF)-like protein
MLSMKHTPIVSDGGVRDSMATFDHLTNIDLRNSQLREMLSRVKRSGAETRKRHRDLQDLATQDPLTGCANRHTLFADLERLWSAAKQDACPLSCVMLEIDHFQSIIDRFGNTVGDQVLEHVAAAIQTAARESELVVRRGGDDFCILLPHTDLDSAVQVAEKFRKLIEATSHASITITASLGLSSLSLGARDFCELLDQADKCLSVAKRGGRNRVVAWDQVSTGMETADVERSSRALDDVSGPDAAAAAIPFRAVTGWLSALACRHAEHSRRVADLCVATASGLMSVAECYELEIAALLHDIGKLGVPDAVLLKPGPLTLEEWSVMNGIDELMLMEMTADLIDLCGTGYGADIPKSPASEDAAETRPGSTV